MVLKNSLVWNTFHVFLPVAWSVLPGFHRGSSLVSYSIGVRVFHEALIPHLVALLLRPILLGLVLNGLLSPVIEGQSYNEYLYLSKFNLNYLTIQIHLDLCN